MVAVDRCPMCGERAVPRRVRRAAVRGAPLRGLRDGLDLAAARRGGSGRHLPGRPLLALGLAEDAGLRRLRAATRSCTSTRSASACAMCCATGRTAAARSTSARRPASAWPPRGSSASRSTASSSRRRMAAHAREPARPRHDPRRHARRARRSRTAHFDLITMWDVVEHVVDPRRAAAPRPRAAGAGRPARGRDPGHRQPLRPRHRRRVAPLQACRAHPALHAVDGSRGCSNDAGFRVEELTHRYGGKYVAPAFIAERAGRVHPALSRMLAPLERLEGRRLYLNFMDEMVVRAPARA